MQAQKNEIQALTQYGKNIGLAFQIRDDILDRIGNKEKLGKKGSDADNQKLTYPALYGIDVSTKMANLYIASAHRSIKLFGKRAHVLHELADFIGQRDH